MERWHSKVIALASIGVILFICTALPIKVASWFRSKGKRGQFYLSVVMCFGGGAFLGAYFMHMAPEVREGLQDNWMKNLDFEYPFPELFTACGFFLLMFIEKTVILCIANKEQPQEIEMKSCAGTETHNDKEIATISNGKPSMNGHANSNGDATKIEEPIDPTASFNHGAGHTHVGATQSLILLLALSLDCIFEGLSLGLQQTTEGVWKIMIAILSHEVVVAFSLGLQLVRHNSSLRVLFYAFIYGLTVPVGVGIGTAITEAQGGGSNPAITLTSSVLSALSGGVFIYVAFFEILSQEISHHSPIAKHIAVLLGFALLAVLAVFHEHDHDHDHDHDDDCDHDHYMQLMNMIIANYS